MNEKNLKNILSYIISSKALDKSINEIASQIESKGTGTTRKECLAILNKNGFKTLQSFKINSLKLIVATAKVSIKDFIRSKTPLYARVPMRRKDGRTKAGFKEIGHTYVQLKSKRLLTDVEKRNSKIAGILEILGIIIGIIVWNFIMTNNALDFSYWTDSWNNKAATP